MPALTFASKLTISGSVATISRESDAVVQEIEAQFPVVVSVTDQTAEARYPTFKGIMAAKKKKITQWSLDDLGVDADQVGLDHAWTRVDATDRRAPRTVGDVVIDDGAGGFKLVEFLTTHKFV